MEKEITKKIRVYGIVQGVGFRPTVSRHADSCKIRGSVSNRGPYVEIFAQGSETAVNLFIEKVRTCPPKRAAILKVSEEILDTKEKYPDFSIIESEKTKEKSLFLRILQSVRNARKNCMIPRIADTYIRLLIVRVVVRGLRFWMLFHMTESVRV